jgi:hypothetical protein
MGVCGRVMEILLWNPVRSYLAAREKRARDPRDIGGIIPRAELDILA